MCTQRQTKPGLCLCNYKFKDNSGSHILYFVSGLGSWSAKLLFYATTAMWRICLFFSFSSFLSSREIILTGNNYELCHTNLGKKTGIENGKECQQDVEKVVFWKSSLFLKLLLY